MNELEILNSLVNTHHVAIKMKSICCAWLGTITFVGESDMHHFAASSFPELVKGFIGKVEDKYK